MRKKQNNVGDLESEKNQIHKGSLEVTEECLGFSKLIQATGRKTSVPEHDGKGEPQGLLAMWKFFFILESTRFFRL